MALAESTHQSGLVLVEETRGEAGLRRSLKQIDSRLRLLPPEAVFPGTANGYWRVMCQWSNERPAVPIVTWMTADGDPAELTDRLIDEVNKLRMGGRNHDKTVDEKNADHEAGVRKQRADAVEALHGDYKAELERGKVSVSMGPRNTVPYWMRRHRGGYAA